MAGHALFSIVSLLPLLASGFSIPAIGVPVTRSQQRMLHSHKGAGSIFTTEWGAECVSRIVPITLERTSDRTYNSDGDAYDIGLFHALANKKILATGTYNITTRLCTPGSKHQASGRRADTIQFLIHGATYNSAMWDWPLESETHSWVRKMNLEGWATFTWDLIGAGNSTRPDGLVEAQVQSHVETAHQLIQQLKSGSIGSKKWKHIVSAGFSIGSATLNSLADQYPDDTEAIILYGFTHNALWVYPGFLAGLQASANQIDPEKWGDVPSAYQTTSTVESRAVACFAGEYDREQLVYDHKHRDLDSLGAAITLVLHMLGAPLYKGHVMVANGDEDATFCGMHCGDGPALVHNYIPKAASYDIKIYPKTGHQLLFHHSGPRFMQDSVDFLTKRGY